MLSIDFPQLSIVCVASVNNSEHIFNLESGLLSSLSWSGFFESAASFRKASTCSSLLNPVMVENLMRCVIAWADVSLVHPKMALNASFWMTSSRFSCDAEKINSPNHRLLDQFLKDYNQDPLRHPISCHCFESYKPCLWFYIGLADMVTAAKILVKKYSQICQVANSLQLFAFSWYWWHLVLDGMVVEAAT